MSSKTRDRQLSIGPVQNLWMTYSIGEDSILPFRQLKFQKIRDGCQLKLNRLVHMLLRSKIVMDAQYQAQLQQRQQRPAVKGRPNLLKVSEFNQMLNDFGYDCFVETEAVSEIPRSLYYLYNWIIDNPVEGFEKFLTREGIRANIRVLLQNLRVLGQLPPFPQQPPIHYIPEDEITHLLGKLENQNMYWKSEIPAVLSSIIHFVLVSRYQHNALLDLDQHVQQSKVRLRNQWMQEVHRRGRLGEEDLVL
uniref:Uncharacterized protein n=1 Tax=viral metagenome TaxID=1070528 RepID=A0A6C0D0S9_9ZZZZ